jgi:hypothetical protein
MPSYYENNPQKNTRLNQPPLLYQSFSEQTQPFPGSSIQQRPSMQPPRRPPMPKHQAQAIVESWKRWIVIASLLSFGILGTLTLGNMPVTSASSTNGNTNATTTGNSLATPTATPDTGGIFQQQQGGFGFGGQQGGNGPVSHSSGS